MNIQDVLNPFLEGEGWGNADCLKSKAELPIEWWLGFFNWRKGK